MREMTFHAEDGRSAGQPLALISGRPTVNLAALGLLFAPPALFGEFYPAAPWSGISLQPARLDDTGSVSPGRAGAACSGAPPVGAGNVRAAFAAAVAELIGDAEVVAVKFSGGLDSLAVLTHACRTAAGRRVLAVTVDLADDLGGSAGATAARLVEQLGLGCDLVVLDPARLSPAAPVWSPIGPRLDAVPRFNAAVAQVAAQAGAGVLLTGDGADEVLGIPRYLAGAVARRHGARGVARYLADVATRPAEVVGELVAAGSRALPAAARARAYWALSWADTFGQPSTPALAGPHRAAADRWAAAWVTERITAHAAAGRAWAAADAWDAVWPHARVLPAGSVPEDSPFLAGPVLAAAHQLELARRFDPDLPGAYQRGKAQVVGLFNGRERAVLPRAKQYVRGALADYTPVEEPQRCIAAGLLDPDRWRTHTDLHTDLAVAIMVAAVEDWLAGAENHGAHIPGVTT